MIILFFWTDLQHWAPVWSDEHYVRLSRSRNSYCFTGSMADIYMKTNNLKINTTDSILRKVRTKTTAFPPKTVVLLQCCCFCFCFYLSLSLSVWEGQSLWAKGITALVPTPCLKWTRFFMMMLWSRPYDLLHETCCFSLNKLWRVCLVGLVSLGWCEHCQSSVVL